jgi:hypothetical protein
VPGPVAPLPRDRVVPPPRKRAYPPRAADRETRDTPVRRAETAPARVAGGNQLPRASPKPRRRRNSLVHSLIQLIAERFGGLSGRIVTVT